MVFLWSLSDSKSSHVSRTLFSILVDLNNAVVWMVAAHPLISNSSSPFFQAFRDCFECTNYNRYHRHFHVPLLFSSLAKSENVSFFSVSSILTRKDGKFHYSAGSLFFFHYYYVWSSGWDDVICLYLKLLDNSIIIIIIIIIISSIYLKNKKDP